jgi:RNA polymerase sigma-70 factor (ECF subfamily)
MADLDRHQLTPILARTVEGDSQALNQLLGKIRPYLHAQIRSRLGAKPSDQLDESAIVQNSLVRIYQHIGRLRQQTVPGLLAWVGRIAHHALIDALRKQDRDPAQPVGERIFELPTRLSDADPAEEAERRQRLAVALTQLPQRQQQVVRWRFYDHLSDAEICARLGDNSSVGAVRVLRCRALRNLKRLIETPDTAPEPEDAC